MSKFPRLYWLIALFLILIVIGGGVIFWWVNRGFDLGDVQAFIGANLPEGASNIQFETNDNFGRIVWLRFEAARETNLSLFWEAMGLEADLREGFTPFPQSNPVEAALSWWQPQSAVTYSGLYANTGAKIYETLVDAGDATRLVIYLRVYALS